MTTEFIRISKGWVQIQFSHTLDFPLEEGAVKTQNPIGTSVRHSSQSAFGRLTGNDVSGHFKRHYFVFCFFLFLGAQAPLQLLPVKKQARHSQISSGRMLF